MNRNKFVGRRFLLALLSAMALCAGACPTYAAQFTILHSFSRVAGEGFGPSDGVTLVGGTLYGVTTSGPSLTVGGTIYAVNTDGSGFHSLHNFTGGAADGNAPFGRPISDGAKLYGATTAGGTASGNAGGIAYSVNLDGTGYTRLSTFLVNPKFPQAALTQIGSTLYGTTSADNGSDVQSMIFKVGTGGGSTTFPHTFTGTASDGRNPSMSAMVANGTMLYGLTADSLTLPGNVVTLPGRLYSLNTTNNAFTILHDFDGGANGSGSTTAGLLLNGSVLYGTTGSTLWSMNTNGTGFQILHTFTGTGAGSEGRPSSIGNLALAGSTLYGGTSQGGANDKGTIYSINLDGSGFHTLYSFLGGANGSGGSGTLAVDGSVIYGSAGGGASNDGIVFALIVPEPSTWLLATMGLAGVLLRCRRRAR